MIASIITPVWNHSILTLSFMKTNHMLFGRNPNVEMVVVDNGSTDNTPGLLAQWARMWNNLTVVTLPENKGFGPGNNAGADVASGDILIFLSNDVRVLGDYLAIILDSLNRQALAGAQLFGHNTGWNSFDGRLIPYIAGWCTICSRDVWTFLEGYDPRYVPCDYEDIDLSLEATEQGLELQELNLPLQHLFGRSALSLPGGRQAITLENQRRFMQKWGFSVLDKPGGN